MIKGESLENISFGDSFTKDNFKGKRFDYMLANPLSCGMEPEYDFIKREHDEEGFAGVLVLACRVSAMVRCSSCNT